MGNHSGGAGGSAQDDFEQLARQYWDGWSELMRGGAPAAPQASVWHDPLAWWSRLAQGGPAPDATDDRVGAQAQGWFERMQQVARQFAGREADAAEVAQAWRQALGGDGGRAFVELLAGLRGAGQAAAAPWAAWAGQLAPWLQRWREETQAWLGLPAFGFAREHQERWQRLARAQVEYQQRSEAYQALLAEAGQLALVAFERKLVERSEPGRQIRSARELFDTWVDAAEEAWAELALSPRFGEAYAAMVDAQMRLRAGVQGEVEELSQWLGLPTRGEVDAAHRKTAQLEREVRRLRDAVAGLQAHGDAQSARVDRAKAAPRKTGARKPATPGAVAANAAKTAAAKKTPAKKTTKTAATRSRARGSRKS